MTSRQRMLIAMTNGQPDMVPVAPDTSNMIPCRLTGKPFWDIYLYQDPPLWEAYIRCCKHFGFDGWLPSVPLQLDYELEAAAAGPQWTEAIVHRTAERIYTRRYRMDRDILDRPTDERRPVQDVPAHAPLEWTDTCTVYYIADPPTGNVPLRKVGLPEGPPETWEEVTPRTNYRGREAFDRARELMGEAGVVGVAVGTPMLGLSAEAVYEWADNRDAVIARCERQGEACVRRAREVVKLQPDFVLTDGFGVDGLGAPSLAVWKGDAVAGCVAAASVIAKVTRDRIMCRAHDQWPQYRFDVHKGYCTPLHQTHLDANGPCEIHRWVFENVRRAADSAGVGGGRAGAGRVAPL